MLLSERPADGLIGWAVVVRVCRCRLSSPIGQPGSSPPCVALPGRLASTLICRTHFARNLLALVPKGHQDMVTAVFRTILAQPDPDTVASTWDQVRDQLSDRFPKIAAPMYDAKAEVLVFSANPGPTERNLVDAPARAAEQRSEAASVGGLLVRLRAWRGGRCRGVVRSAGGARPCARGR